MNRFVKILIILALLPVSIMLPVFLAQTISLDSQVYAQTSTQQQRVEQYKTKLGTAPTQSELNKLKLHCTVAQGNLKTLDTRVEKVQEKRTKAYTTINERLQKLIDALNAKSIATDKLGEQAKELKAKTDTFNTDLAAYKQAVTDASAMDCAADPLAMKAALQESRNIHDRLVTEITGIREHVNNLVKPSLVQVKADLQAQQNAANPATPPATPEIQEGQPNAAQ